MKYYRIVETCYGNNNRESHIFIKHPENIEEHNRFDFFKNIISLLKNIDLEQVFGDEYGEFNETHSSFNFSTFNDELKLFDESVVNILLEERFYSANCYYLATLSDDIFKCNEHDLATTLCLLEKREIFETFS